MRLLLALLLGASGFAEVTLEAPEGTCEREGAIACVELAPGEAMARVGGGASYALLDAEGRTLVDAPLAPDGFVPLVPGAAKLVVYAA